MTIFNRILLLVLIIAIPCSSYSRYYHPRTATWLSADPPLMTGEYLPKPSDFDNEHDMYWYTLNDKTNKLPGMGGVFNPVNLNAYQYAGLNPVKFVDPDGNALLDTGITLKKGDTVPVGWMFQSKSFSRYDNIIYRLGPQWVAQRNREVLILNGGNRLVKLSQEWKSATSKINSGDRTTSITIIASNTGKRDDEGNAIYNLSVRIQEGKKSETTSLYFFTAKDKLISDAIIKEDVSMLMNNISGSTQKPVEVKVEDKR